jgi:trimeric autotransporter adhesin
MIRINLRVQKYNSTGPSKPVSAWPFNSFEISFWGCLGGSRVNRFPLLLLVVSMVSTISLGDSTTRLASLPLAAQASISARLGHDNVHFCMRNVAGGFEATNEQRTLKADFAPTGVEITSGLLRIGFALSGYDRNENNFKSLRLVTPEATANRVEYKRGSLTEWYVNGPLGLEQGFTLQQPSKTRRSQMSTLLLTLTGNYVGHVVDKGKTLSLSSRDGRNLIEYKGLSAFDAVGTELRAWLDLRDGVLRINVNTESAVYPITIDPIIQLAELTASDGAARDGFGQGVAVSGDTVVVAAPLASVDTNQYQGALYVFVKPVTGWANATQNAKLVASDGQANDYLGFNDVAINGDTIVAGAIGRTIGSNPGQGVVFVFVKPVGGWHDMTQTAELTASDGQKNDDLGNAVATNGTSIIAGAYQSASSAVGKAYIYERPLTGWTDATETAELSPSADAPGFLFGISVGINNSLAVVGSRDTVNLNFSQGAAFVFTRPATGWNSTSKFVKELIASDGAANAGFSSSLSLNGETLVIGTAYAEVNGNLDQGEAYIFTYPSGRPAGESKIETETARLTASDGQANDQFGESVSTNGRVVAIGAPAATVLGGEQQGTVYLYAEPSNGWSTTSQFDAKITSLDGGSSTYFGSSVGLNGNTLVVGAPNATINSNQDQGAASIFGNQ